MSMELKDGAECVPELPVGFWENTWMIRRVWMIIHFLGLQDQFRIWTAEAYKRWTLQKISKLKRAKICVRTSELQ